MAQERLESAEYRGVLSDVVSRSAQELRDREDRFSILIANDSA